ncbi:MAG: response regulator [Desulfarculus sp.]|nr:response regulator [Desulfarculus sp.]
MSRRDLSSVLVVDDDPVNIHLLLETLKERYKVIAATNGARALAMAQGGQPPDLILLDVNMPGMSGYEVCRRLKEGEGTRSIPVIFVTALDSRHGEAAGLALGAADYITKPFIPALVLARVHNHLELKRHRDHLEEMVRQRTAELQETRDVIILSLASLAETRDNETGNHIARTQHYVRLLAEALSSQPRHAEHLTPQTVDLLQKSAPLHDIGKVGVPDVILLKPGQLTHEEFEEMKKHAVYGHDAIQKAADRLGPNSFLALAQEIAHTHHERWDGNGYPRGLAGEDIPLSGRMMALADVFDALVSRRVYKPPIPFPQAVEIIAQGRGTFFDPQVADAFALLKEEFRRVGLFHADHDEERAALERTK